MLDSSFSRFTFCIFFFMIFLSFGAGAENILDGSGYGSEQNVSTAPATVEMCRPWWLRLRISAEKFVK